MRHTRAIWAGLLVAAVSTSEDAAGDWPQWRGANRDGVAQDLSVPEVWPDSLALLWQREVGEGHASPVVAGGRVYLHSRIDDGEVMSCFDLETGKLIWRQRNEAHYEMNAAARGHGKGPKATPAVAGERVIGVGITAIISCYNRAGTLMWRRRFWEEYPQQAPLYGTAASPLIDGELVYAHVGGHDAGALVALWVNDGSVRWRWEGDGPGYASPVLIEVDGARLIVTQSQDYCVAVDAASGRTAWELPYTTAWDQNIVTPVSFDGNGVVFSGLDKGTTAFRFARDGEAWSAEQVWQNPEVSMYMSSPVLADSLLFGMMKKRRGRFFCLDARTGKTLWTSPDRQGENASLIDAGTALLALTTDGELQVIRTSTVGYDLLRRYQLAATPTWAHLAAVDHRVIVKDATTLSVWDMGGGK